MDTIFKLEESTPKNVPRTFETLVTNVFQERNSLVRLEKSAFLNVFTLENDLTACIVLTVLLEKGFVLQRSEGKTPSFDLRILRKTDSLPPNCRKRDDCCYKFNMYLPFLDSYVFNIVLVPLCGDLIVINIVIKKFDEIQDCLVQSLKPARYLAVLNPGVSEKFTDLKEVCGSVGRIVERVRTLCMNAEGLSTPSLLGIPREVKEKIFAMLPVQTFIQLTATCKHLNSFAKDPNIWKLLLKRDFDTVSATRDEYIIYREIYKENKKVNTPSTFERTEENPQPGYIAAQEPPGVLASNQFEDFDFRFMSLQLDMRH